MTILIPLCLPLHSLPAKLITLGTQTLSSGSLLELRPHSVSGRATAPLRFLHRLIETRKAVFSHYKVDPHSNNDSEFSCWPSTNSAPLVATFYVHVRVHIYTRKSVLALVCPFVTLWAVSSWPCTMEHIYAGTNLQTADLNERERNPYITSVTLTRSFTRRQTATTKFRKTKVNVEQEALPTLVCRSPK